MATELITKQAARDALLKHKWTASEWSDIKRIIGSIPSCVTTCGKCAWAVFDAYGKAYACSYLLNDPKRLFPITEYFFCAYGEPLNKDDN